MKDTLVIGGHEFQSRFILGSGKYSLDLINAAVQNAGAQIITLALRRANEGGTANILDYIPEGVTLLPKMKVEVVVSKVPVRTVIETAKAALRTGHIGDGKLFVYDVENVVRVRTGEEGYDALQDD